ncbi:energy transducer TonB [Sphingomonas sp. QA11]|uniref:energy transducer TonB n=1 Tax=Sphingomonas sp. QA11 TaxID=2950605 RepID=UPI00234A4CA5|nr:energy transducer TonB [Sphingomonas sp. QA11]WCM27741.1 energy transducer TonB [Sphingomonas sp. QA11]
MTYLQSNPGDRIKAALGAAALQGLLVYALVMGLAVKSRGTVENPLTLFGVLPPPPPPPPEKTRPHPIKSVRREGAASPANLRSKATEIVAPVPIVQPVVPPPVVAALKPATGNQASTGAAPVPGPGTGAGGVGNGTGSGRSGDGDGDGGAETPPRWIRGRIKDSDYPRAAKEALIQGTVSVRYVVAETGRVTECTVTTSSGNAELDETTCRLIRERFRFKPSKDEGGKPVSSIIIENHSWLIDDRPEPTASPAP